MHANYCGMAINGFKQALHLPVAVATTQEHSIFGISEARCVVVRINIDPWVALQGSTKDPIENVVDGGRRECTSLSNAEVYLKRRSLTPTCKTIILVDE